VSSKIYVLLFSSLEITCVWPWSRPKRGGKKKKICVPGVRTAGLRSVC